MGRVNHFMKISSKNSHKMANWQMNRPEFDPLQVISIFLRYVSDGTCRCTRRTNAQRCVENGPVDDQSHLVGIYERPVLTITDIS